MRGGKSASVAEVAEGLSRPDQGEHPVVLGSAAGTPVGHVRLNPFILGYAKRVIIENFMRRAPRSRAAGL